MLEYPWSPPGYHPRSQSRFVTGENPASGLHSRYSDKAETSSDKERNAPEPSISPSQLSRLRAGYYSHEAKKYAEKPEMILKRERDVFTTSSPGQAAKLSPRHPEQITSKRERNVPRILFLNEELSVPNQDPSFQSARSPIRLQSIMKRNTGSEYERNRNRVSFTRQDDLLEFENDEETCIKEARNEWTASRRTSRAAELWDEETEEQDRLLEGASAYDFDGFTRGNHLPTASSRRESKNDHSRESAVYPKPYRQQIPTGARPQYRVPFSPKAPPNGHVSPSMRYSPGRNYIRQREKGHFHRHGYTGCEHGFLDLIDCSCEDPERVIVAKGSCSDCLQARAQQKNLETSTGGDIGIKQDDNSSTDTGSRKKRARKLLF
ncbi:hypothetical protein TWF694_003215 [Orbilia ellipsospora]|uniref:Uncharacterized protein n=1 Tax=Orbilia ellipsospora TaxID=2528407 RepID=A0AAV9X239_9PEZI